MPNLKFTFDFIREVGPFRWAFRMAARQFQKHVVRRDYQMRLPTGEWIILPLTSRFASEVFVTGANVDWGSEKLLSLLMEARGAFLDVGANIGYYSLYLLPKASAVYSFEPDPRTRKSLEQNASGKSKIEIVPLAVGAARGEALFALEASPERSHLTSTNENSGKYVKVDVTTIDAFVSERGLKVECIKIDIEGGDTEAIAGAMNVLTTQKPLVLTEARPDDALFALTRKAGYRVFAFIRHPRTHKRSFAELLPEVPAPGATKMLFLVPQHLAARIVEKAANC
jgi:FkbM family methyltransferase